MNLPHPFCIVVNSRTHIGANCIIRNSVTIGNKGNASDDPDGCPVIGDNVNIGANCVIIGPVHIGNNAVIGAGSVVVKDVPDGTTVVGNPAIACTYSNTTNF